MPTKAKEKPSPALAHAVDRPASAVLLTPEQLGERLSVPSTWIREKCRERARLRDKDPLPIIKLGKYVRFDWEAVCAWLSRQAS